MIALPEDLRSLLEVFDANERDARELIAGLSAEAGTWHPAPDAWSVAQCLEHLAAGNRLYVAAW